jgi:hypothetical protein
MKTSQQTHTTSTENQPRILASENQGKRDAHEAPILIFQNAHNGGQIKSSTMKTSQQTHTTTNENAAMLAPACEAAHEFASAPALAPDIAAKINALHATTQRLEKESRSKLDGAVAAAWQADKLLIEAKACITHHGGRGAWTPWIETKFEGDMRTAQRYMRLARELPEAPSPDGLSLRQLYFRLGIATEPKRASAENSDRDLAGKLPMLPAYLTLANKLVLILRRQPRDKIQACDLTALYRQLRPLFEPDTM